MSYEWNNTIIDIILTKDIDVFIRSKWCVKLLTVQDFTGIFVSRERVVLCCVCVVGSVRKWWALCPMEPSDWLCRVLTCADLHAVIPYTAWSSLCGGLWLVSSNLVIDWPRVDDESKQANRRCVMCSKSVFLPCSHNICLRAMIEQPLHKFWLKISPYLSNGNAISL